MRLLLGLGTALGSAAIVIGLYPLLHPERPPLYPALLGAIINQIWALGPLAQALLGEPVFEDEDQVPAKRRSKRKPQRPGLVVLGAILAIVLTSLFLAVLGETRFDQ